jgi:hypothetical protein
VQLAPNASWRRPLGLGSAQCRCGERGRTSRKDRGAAAPGQGYGDPDRVHTTWGARCPLVFLNGLEATPPPAVTIPTPDLDELVTHFALPMRESLAIVQRDHSSGADNPRESPSGWFLGSPS